MDARSSAHALAYVDLRTGSTRDIPFPAGASVPPFAWSPDQNRVAVAVQQQPDDYEASRGQLSTPLSVLDLRTVTFRDVPAVESVVLAAAWAPDSHQLAVSTASAISHWRESVRRQHPYEIGLLRDEDLRAVFGPVKLDLSACVAVVVAARRRNGFLDFAPAVLAFVLIGPAQELHEPERPAELVNALFGAAG